MNLTNKRRLTALSVKRISEPGRYHDGHGLMLFVRARPGLTKSWVQRIVVKGQRIDMGLGGWPLVSLAEARDQAFLNRQIARRGGDPRVSGRAPTFEDAARKVHVLHSPSIGNERYRRQWIDELARYAFPAIGSMRADDVTMRDVMNLLVPIWHSKPKLARQMRQRIEKIFDWSIVQGHRPDNPAGVVLKAALPAQKAVVRHHDAVPHADVGQALARKRGPKVRREGPPHGKAGGTPAFLEP